MEARMQEMAINLQEVDDRSKSNMKRLDKLEVKIETFLELTTSVKMIAQSVQYIQEDVKSVKDNMKELDGKMETMQEEITEAQNRPDKERADTMRSLGEKILWLVVGGVVAFLFYEATGVQL